MGPLFTTSVSQSGYLSENTTEKKKTADGIPFVEFLKQAFNEVNDLQRDAEKKVEEIALGKASSFHDVVIAMEKASLALEFFTQIQNKLVEAYQEIMRLQL
ncbi:MAG: flagellar hook-basal body complex protein FliE [Thermacetogeniaceae bacterium]